MVGVWLQWKENIAKTNTNIHAHKMKGCEFICARCELGSNADDQHLTASGLEGNKVNYCLFFQSVYNTEV